MIIHRSSATVTNQPTPYQNKTHVSNAIVLVTCHPKPDPKNLKDEINQTNLPSTCHHGQKITPALPTVLQVRTGRTPNHGDNTTVPTRTTTTMPHHRHLSSTVPKVLKPLSQ